MKILNFKSIRTRLTYWFLILTFIPLITVLVITYFQRVSAMESQTFDKLTAIRDLKVIQLKAWITERTGDLKTISEDHELTDLEYLISKTSQNISDEKLIENSRHILNRYINNYPDYAELFIVNPINGKIIVSTKKYMEGVDKSRDEYFTDPLQSKKLSFKNIYYSNTLSANSMVYSIPIFCSEHNNKHIVGILVARINLQNSLYKMLLERVGLGESGETLIVNENVVALNKLRWHENAPLNLQINAEPAIKAANGETGITVTTDYRNEPIMAAYTYIPETGWGFISKQDMSELNEPIRQMIWNFLFIFFIASIIISIVALRISQSISSPIIELNKIAKKFGAGNLAVRNTKITDDELGTLATEFNNMANAMEARLITQEGVADIAEKMIAPSSMQEFGSELLKQIMDTTGAAMSVFYILNEGTMEFEHFTSIGGNKELLKPFSATNSEGEIGNAIATKNIYYLRNIDENTIFKYNAIAGSAIPREIITIPILIEETVVAIISVISINKFKDNSYQIIKESFAAINTSYSNLMAGERTRIFADQLAYSNQQLEAQAEEMQDQAEEMQEQAEEMQEQAEELQRSSEELQEQNIELDSQKKQVESANKLKSEFLSNMSHELRTPLNSINALSYVLSMQAKDKLDDEENNYLKIIERNGKHLLELINNILDLSKIEAGKMELAVHNIPIKSVVTIAKENLQALAEKKNIALNLNLEDQLSFVETDESKLYQVLLNIISNAVKFTEEGGVDISVKQDEENLIVKVEDTGIGISEDMLPHIFDEFRQVDGSTSRQFEGTGLGLSIAKKIIDHLGCKISVESELGKGSVFTIYIPIEWSGEMILDNNYKAEASIPNTLEEMDSQSEIIKNPTANRILLVEDNKDAIVQLKAILVKANFKVDVATGGQEAIDYIKYNIPDGIILDLMMPDVDGFQVLENIRSTVKTKNIPVLILTAKDLTKKDLSTLSSNNIQQLIHKGNVDMDGLLNKVGIMLGNISEDKNIHKPKVLIIEDNPDNMTTIKAIIKDKYETLEALDGEEGLEMIRSQMPNMILLDMSLPKKSGEELLKIIKNESSSKNIPIIAVTAQSMKGDRERILNLGCDGYVSKPVEPDILLAEMDRLIKTN